MALNFDIKDPKTQKSIAIIMVPIVLLYGFFNFMIKPKMAELETKKAEVTELDQRIQITKRSLRDPAELTSEKEALEAKYVELEKLLPDEENVALLIDQLSDIEYKAKVYLVGFNATQTIEGRGKPYRANQYRITIQAGYHQFAEFMSLIMSLPRILSFSELRISMNTELGREEQVESEGPVGQPRNLSIECIMTSYVFSMDTVKDTSEN